MVGIGCKGMFRIMFWSLKCLKGSRRHGVWLMWPLLARKSLSDCTEISDFEFSKPHHSSLFCAFKCQRISTAIHLKLIMISFAFQINLHFEKHCNFSKGKLTDSPILKFQTTK
ncbi:hypothetical protein V8G54_031034 [Vigna mungo]|uniref:Uncharacterized protein n=1 Tax=Vigna mungo TaxID=3915 RepID=A0AAQ3RKP6_VIGMU